MLTAGQSRPHRRVFAAIAVCVLVAHAWLLGTIDVGLGGGRDAPAMAAPVQVREVAAAAPAAEPAVADAPAPAAAPAAVPVALPVRRPRAARPAAEAPAAAASVVAEVAVAPAVEPAAAPEAVAVAAAEPDAAPTVPVEDTAPVSTGDAPPTYPTHLPPAATLRYDLQRGPVGGTGELRWQPDGARYTLRLDGSVVGLVVLTQASEGGLGASGLAPQRFTDRRARRSTLAANFDRAGRRVTFSGAAQPVPLHEGAQDRLSWMLQLAAIAAADPSRGAKDAQTALQVVGARGDSSVWVFRSLGRDTVATRAGTVQALHLVREPRGEHDTGVDVWLDPARHHLPVRATMRNGGDGDVFELRLRELTIGG